MGFEPMFKDESLSPKPSTFLRGFKFSLTPERDCPLDDRAKFLVG